MVPEPYIPDSESLKSQIIPEQQAINNDVVRLVTFAVQPLKYKNNLGGVLHQKLEILLITAILTEYIPQSLSSRLVL